jgi:ATP-dependent DNA helicase RecG
VKRVIEKSRRGTNRVVAMCQEAAIAPPESEEITGAVEVWGRGTNQVIETCKKHGVPPPTVEERKGFLIVTFQAKVVAGTFTEPEQADDRGASEKTSEKASEKILAILAANPETTIAELAGKTGITTRSIERNLPGLLARGRLKRIGPDKGSHWEVTR